MRLWFGAVFKTNNMAKLALKTGTQANLPTSGMIEEGCLYFCTDTGNIYYGASSTLLILLSRNDFYGTCDTAAASQVKVVTLQNADGFALRVGTVIRVKFTYTNSYNATSSATVQLNVNSTGAKNIVGGASAVATGTNATYFGRAGYVNTYVYNGSQWVWCGSSADNNTTYTPQSLGFGYGTCSTAAATVAKVVTLSSYNLTSNGFVAVKFTYAVPASATMNINSKGAKAIYYKGAAITANIIQAGDIGIFVYNGSQYHLITTDRLAKNAVTGLSISGKTITVTKADGTTSTLTTQDTTYTPESLGNGYAECNTSSGTALTATLTNYVLKKNGFVTVLFNYDVPANATLNINEQGACSIMCRNRGYGNTIASISDGYIRAGSFATFVCYEVAQNTYCYLLTSEANFNLVNAVGSGSLQGRNNPYGATSATGANALVIGEYLGTSTGDNVLVAASTSNNVVTGNQGAILASNGGASVAGDNSVVIAGRGSNDANNSAIIGSTSCSIAEKDSNGNDVSQSVVLGGYSGTLNESQTTAVHNLKNTFGDKWDSNGITTKEGTIVNSSIRAVGDIDTQYTNGQSTWNFKTLNAIASIVNEWFSYFNSKLHDWFDGVDNSVRRVTVVKKIDAAVAAKTTLFTVPNGFIAFGNGNQTQAIMLNIFYPGKMGNGSTTYSNIDFTFECVDSYAIQSGAPAGYKYSTSGSLTGGGSINNSYMFGTTGNGADAGDITLEITSKMQYYGERGTLFDLPENTYFLYVKMELLLLPKNS